MIIDEKTAQLILDAITWSNHEWIEDTDIPCQHEEQMAKTDFVRFCEARGIEGIERVMEV